jgi:endoglucanase
MVPGHILVNPGFPEWKEDWPFMWGESEYVITAATQFILVANAADSLVK